MRGCEDQGCGCETCLAVNRLHARLTRVAEEFCRENPDMGVQVVYAAKHGEVQRAQGVCMGILGQAGSFLGALESLLGTGALMGLSCAAELGLSRSDYLSRMAERMVTVAGEMLPGIDIQCSRMLVCPSCHEPKRTETDDGGSTCCSACGFIFGRGGEADDH